MAKNNIGGTESMVSYLESLGFSVTQPQAKTSRGMTSDRIWQKLFRHLDELGESTGMWYEPVDLYWDNDSGSLNALTIWSGDYYLFSLDESGDDLVIGDATRHAPSYEPVQRSSTVLRKADGSIEFVDVMSVAVVNKDGEIDSTELYDNMIARAKRTGKYPIREFCHLGETIQTGQYTDLMRVGSCYIGRGYYLLDEELTNVEIEAIENHPENWGLSIGYTPIARGADAKHGGRSFPVYTDGIHIETSVLRAVNACSYFTSTGLLGDNHMPATTRQRSLEPTPRQIEDLLHLYKDAGRTQEEAMEFLERINIVNERAKDLVSRTFTDEEEEDETPPTEGEDETPPTEGEDETPPAEGEDETPPSESEEDDDSSAEDEEGEDEEGADEEPIEIDDDVIEAVVTRSVIKLRSAIEEPLLKRIGALEAMITEYKAEQAGMVDREEALKNRIGALEALDVDRMERLKSSSSTSGNRRRRRAIVRPSSERKKTSDVEASDANDPLGFAAKADETTSKMRRSGRN